MAGRKPFVPTEADRKLVSSLAGYGAPHEYIAGCITNPQTGQPLNEKSLRKYFRVELDSGKHRANTMVTQSLFRHATGNGRSAVVACIFWLKTQAGWKEPAQGIELTGKEGGPVEQRTTVVDEEKVAAIVAKLRSEY
ncbi:hypothetical protein ACSI5F_03875 [Ralstonia pseudosolanacearum]|uniref:hypothetical protein n=1 Tax=Ralstonia pseudosolanacearum TaxID=1310165 RepID=UPI003EE231E1